MLPRGKRFRFKAPLKILDSTLISLCHSAYEWAVYRTGKGAAKMHVLLDTSDVMPDYVHITAGREHDLVMKRLLRVPEGTIVVFDRGYNDHGFYDDLTYRRVHFVTRMRSNTRYDVVREDQVPASIDHVILSNQVVQITGSGYYYRRVVALDEETGKEVALLSNLLNFGPTTISNIYRARWKIEEFFRQIKQNLRISTFVGTSRNAFEIQIWTALIALLILSWLRHRSRSGWSFSVLAAMVRFILLSNINLDDWLTDPVGQIAQQNGHRQMELVFG
jgi:IS4 transposase